MQKRQYIIKNLAPWMLDELIAFSECSNFQIILLRYQSEFYEDGLKKLVDKGVDIKIQPYSTNRLFKKLKVAIKFLFSNIFKFGFGYNFIVGIKSIYWFLRIDINHFSKESVLHSQFATQAALLSLLIKKYFNDEIKYYFTFHAYDIYFKNKWFSMLTNESESCFSISEYNIKYVQEKYLKSDKIKLSRLGVFRKEPFVERKFNSNHKDKFIIGVLSWFVEKKGIKYLLSAMDKLSKGGHKQIELIIAGDGPLKEEYKEFIKENNLHNVVSLIGKVKDKRKEEFYKKIDLFVLPSISLDNDQDGIPVVLMEAISFGLPIISTNISGIPEICINDYNGKLINEKNTDEIVTAVLELSNDQKKYQEFSSNSLKLSEEYDILKNSSYKLKMMEWI